MPVLDIFSCYLDAHHSVSPAGFDQLRSSLDENLLLFDLLEFFHSLLDMGDLVASLLWLVKLTRGLSLLYLGLS